MWKKYEMSAQMLEVSLVRSRNGSPSRRDAWSLVNDEGKRQMSTLPCSPPHGDCVCWQDHGIAFGVGQLVHLPAPVHHGAGGVLYAEVGGPGGEGPDWGGGVFARQGGVGAEGEPGERPIILVKALRNYRKDRKE